jgi:NAD(P)-dependent dehydrogenase (short-subunit alcohol dehydrogenase family)
MTGLSRSPVTLIGASRGLGRVLAETFHRLGAQLLVVARGRPASTPWHATCRA